MNTEFDGELFSARVLEFSERAGRGAPAPGDFYTPREIRMATEILLRHGKRGTFAFFGGYPTAERRRLCCLPDYMIYDETEEGLSRAAADVVGEDIAVLRVRGSGYRTLSHRDFMGAILNLGIKRHTVGDIIADEDGFGAYVFCERKIGRFIVENLSRVASDAVTVCETELPEGFAPERKTEPIADTVASERADCVVAALVNTSRDRAKSLIVSGFVEVNYEPMEKPDEKLEPGDTVTVRGEGKFRIEGFDGVTRRGRLRLSAEKFI